MSKRFYRRGHLNAWVRRIGADADVRDCAAVARAITLAIRHRGIVGADVALDRICEIAVTPRHDVLAAIYRLQAAGRLHYTVVKWVSGKAPVARWHPSAFDFTISSAADEAACARPASAHAAREHERMGLKEAAGC
jgi:hypothetical protein